MSLPDRITRRAAILAAFALPLAACGLQPVYGPNGTGKRILGKIRPRDPKSFQEFAFNQRLTERLGPDSNAQYDLDYQINMGVVAQAITQEEVTTRYSLNGTADFLLKDSNGKTVTSGRVSSFTSYSTTGTTIATLSAEADARQRLSKMLADQVVTRLLAASAALPEQ